MQRKVCNTADNMAKITVQNTQITVIKQNEDDYISLTDMLKAKDGEFFFSNWLRNRNTIEFLGIWERLMNPNFNCAEFDIIKSQAGLNNYRLSAKEWMEKTKAIGIISKAGRYGGTYAHKDIAFRFAMWLSPAFQLYCVKELQRLKAEESNPLIEQWNVKRILSKTNYQIHTDAIKNVVIPQLTVAKQRESLVYALDHANLEIEKGEICVILGPSGSGKSTFLRCLNLMEHPSAGSIFFQGQEITDPKADINAIRQNIGMVFQHFNLFPNMTVRQNITLAPVLTGRLTPQEAAEKADEKHNPARDHTGEHSRMDQAAHRFVILGAPGMGDTDADAHRQSHEYIDDQIDQRARRADGGYRDAAAESSDDNEVGGVEKQLQNAREHQRKRKPKQLARQWAVAHINFIFSLFHYQ